MGGIVWLYPLKASPSQIYATSSIGLWTVRVTHLPLYKLVGICVVETKVFLTWNHVVFLVVAAM